MGAAEIMPGIVLTNRPLRAETPALYDLTATIMDVFGDRKAQGYDRRIDLRRRGGKRHGHRKRSSSTRTSWTRSGSSPQLSGYSSVEEFITHCLEKEIAKIEEADSEDEIKKKLKGLGYIG